MKPIPSTPANRRWKSDEQCDACGEVVDRVVTVGEEPDYESSTATLCRTCLVEALAVLDAAP